MMNNQIENHDVYLTSFLDLNGIDVDFKLAPTGRVIFLLPCKKETHDMIRAFHSNPKVSVLDYVQSLRKIRARMIAMRS